MAGQIQLTVLFSSPTYVPENSASFFEMVAVRIDYQEEEPRSRAKSAGAHWDPELKAWWMLFKQTLAMDLEKRILPKQKTLQAG